MSACQRLHVSAPPACSISSILAHARRLGEWWESFQIRSKSLEEEEKRDRRISWGVDGEEARRRAAGKRRFSEELKRRRHTVAGDTRESR